MTLYCAVGGALYGQAPFCGDGLMFAFDYVPDPLLGDRSAKQCRNLSRKRGLAAANAGRFNQLVLWVVCHPQRYTTMVVYRQQHHLWGRLTTFVVDFAHE